MPGEISLPSKIENEQSYNLNSSFFIEYLFAILMLRQAGENAIKHRVLVEKIASYQKHIAVCESNIQSCEKDIQKSHDYIQVHEKWKQDVFKLCQEFSTVTKDQKLGDCPKSEREITVKDQFICKKDRLTLCDPKEEISPRRLKENTIYLQVNEKKKVLCCRLRIDKKHIAQTYIRLEALWCIKNGSEVEDFHKALENVFDENIIEFRINLLEKLAKKKCIPNPYEVKLELYGQKEAELEGLIKDAQLQIEEQQGIEEENMRHKSEYEAKLTLAQQELAAIKKQLEPIPSNQATTSILAPPYQTRVVQPCFFYSRDDGRKAFAKTQEHPLHVVEPQFKSNRECREESTERLGYRFKK